MENDSTRQLPVQLTLNAYAGRRDGGGVSGALADDYLQWVLQEGVVSPQPPAKLWSDDKPAPDFSEWDEAKGGVGWSLLLPLHPDYAVDAQPAAPVDAPKPIQTLWKRRHAPPIYRYDPATREILRCSKGNKPQQIHTVLSPYGTGPHQLPYYLLIYGAPREELVPWDVQFELNGTRAVGRLDLPEPGVQNYVKQLLKNWSDCRAVGSSSVLWAVDHSADITELMADVIIDPMHSQLGRDVDLQVTRLRGQDATHLQLQSMIQTQRPGLIMTTSHGSVDLFASVRTRSRRLGNLVDQNYTELTGPTLKNMDVGGAIWYAHACCSAGSYGFNRYGELIAPRSPAAYCLAAAAEAGPRTATLPQKLLGSQRPLRAFVGKVDPTFDYTLRDSLTGQNLTPSVVGAFYQQFFRQQPIPIGHALRQYFDRLAGLFTMYDSARTLINSGRGNQTAERLKALITLLLMRDMQSTVILGDPTVARAVP